MIKVACSEWSYCLINHWTANYLFHHTFLQILRAYDLAIINDSYKPDILWNRQIVTLTYCKKDKRMFYTYAIAYISYKNSSKFDISLLTLLSDLCFDVCSLLHVIFKFENYAQNVYNMKRNVFLLWKHCFYSKQQLQILYFSNYALFLVRMFKSNSSYNHMYFS